jgi:putative ABC transport system substrate-binding protein
MDRRTFLVGAFAAGASAVPRPARAQARTPRVGFLGNSTAALEAPLVSPFREGLRELGHVEGQSIHVEYRWAGGSYARLPTLVAELVAEKVEVIVTAGTPASLAVQKGAPGIPLVMVAVGDPVKAGLVASLARPGGNVTGLTSIAAELEGKRLEILREVLPKLSHVAVLWNPASPFSVVAEGQVQAAAQVMRLAVQSLGVQAAGQFDAAFEAMARERPGALVVLADRLFLHERTRIVEFATRHRLPIMAAYRELVEAGGLMSFGPSYAAMHKRAAFFVDRILKGTKPADLPVEQPAQFELILNMKAARAMGLTVPLVLRLRASEVIE